MRCPRVRLGGRGPEEEPGAFHGRRALVQSHAPRGSSAVATEDEEADPAASPEAGRGAQPAAATQEAQAPPGPFPCAPSGGAGSAELWAQVTATSGVSSGYVVGPAGMRPQHRPSAVHHRRHGNSKESAEPRRHHAMPKRGGGGRRPPGICLGLLPTRLSQRLQPPGCTKTLRNRKFKRTHQLSFRLSRLAQNAKYHVPWGVTWDDRVLR